MRDQAFCCATISAAKASERPRERTSTLKCIFPAFSILLLVGASCSELADDSSPRVLIAFLVRFTTQFFPLQVIGSLCDCNPQVITISQMNPGRPPLFALLLVLVGTAALAEPTRATEPAKGPFVGAIRWDGWFAGNAYESHLVPREWRSRLPFYASILPDNGVEVRSDKQEVMDREIDFAAKAGLSYWAFCYYHPKSWTGAHSFNYGSKLYLSSNQKTKLNFCLLLQGMHLGPKAEWPQTVQSFVHMFQEPTYQTVLDGRPLVFIYSLPEMKKWSGSAGAAKRALDDLREQCGKLGLKNPYMVAQVYRPEDGVEAVETLGFDAISSYSLPGGSRDREYPFQKLAEANRSFWDACKATGKPVIPIVNSGWDNRPRRGKPHDADLSGPWFTEPTPAELANHLRSAIEWNRTNASAAPANTIIIYAWNESDEGGWLVPTLSQGSARLDAIHQVLQPLLHK